MYESLGGTTYICTYVHTRRSVLLSSLLVHTYGTYLQRLFYSAIQLLNSSIHPSIDGKNQLGTGHWHWHWSKAHRLFTVPNTVLYSIYLTLRIEWVSRYIGS